MPQPKTQHAHPPGHVLAPSAAIGGLSIILAAGLEALGMLSRTNAVISRIVSRNGAESFPKQLPDWSIWLATTLIAIGLAFAILATPGHWRRVILWISAVVLVAGWAPVLSLAAHAPEIGAPWIATVWSGVCAIVYAANHQMACDPSPTPADEPR